MNSIKHKGYIILNRLITIINYVDHLLYISKINGKINGDRLRWEKSNR